VHDKPSSCEQYRTPPLYLLVRGEQMHWITRWDAKKCSVGDTAQGSKWITSSVVERDRWIDWVVHVHWSYGPDGLVEIWRNGVRIANYRGPNDYNDEFEHYLKIGGYMWHGFRAPIVQRVSFLDEVRMGGPKATYADVAPTR
ncbi:heparin lyase I family protein, partial [Klebsiella pneumoniae]